MLIGASKVLSMDIDEASVTNFIINTSCQQDGIIYAFRPNSSSDNFEPNIVHSYCALAILKMLKFDTNIIDKNLAIKWISSLVNANGTLRV